MACDGSLKSILQGNLVLTGQLNLTRPYNPTGQPLYCQVSNVAQTTMHASNSVHLLTLNALLYTAKHH